MGEKRRKKKEKQTEDDERVSPRALRNIVMCSLITQKRDLFVAQ